MKNQTIAVEVLPDGSQIPMNFRRLVEVNGVCVSDMAEWCQLSRQVIYKYMNGDVNPLNVSYVNVTNMATFLDETPTVVYNSLCESFESKRIYCETLGKWMLPEEIVDKVR